jgi:choline dehydrogenase
VTLKSTDPLEAPEVNFNFFAKGEQEDLQVLYDAVKFIDSATSHMANTSGLLPIQQSTPCPSTTSTSCTEKEIKEILKTQAYSRHATGTCAMGDTTKDPLAVVDSRFRVKGVNRLRVVDASVFPKPPGAFPILPTFIISRKAAKVILEGEDELR